MSFSVPLSDEILTEIEIFIGIYKVVSYVETYVNIDIYICVSIDIHTHSRPHFWFCTGMENIRENSREFQKTKLEFASTPAITYIVFAL